jgi:hypothetical protein
MSHLRYFSGSPIEFGSPNRNNILPTMYSSSTVTLFRSRSRKTRSWRFFELLALVLLVITAVLVRGLKETDRTSVPQSVTAEGESSEKVLYQQESDLTSLEGAEEGGKVYSSDAHKAADIGDLSTLHRIKSENPAMLHESDSNGWHPLHFAIRSGRYDVAKFLVENGADVKHYTNDGTAMEIAKDSLHPDDPIVHLLHTVNGNLFGALNGGFSVEL